MEYEAMQKLKEKLLEIGKENISQSNKKRINPTLIRTSAPYPVKVML